MKRIISLILVLSMMLSTVPVVASAANEVVIYTEVEEAEVRPGDVFTCSVYLSGTYTGYSLKMNKNIGNIAITDVASVSGVNADDRGDYWELSIAPNDPKTVDKHNLATITFAVDEEAAQSTQKIAFSEILITDENYDKATVVENCASITVAAKEIVATGIELDRTELYLAAGKTTQLVATVIPPEATMDKTVTWSSDNTSVATVDANTGVITAVAKASGTVHITATLVADPSITATATVNVAYLKGMANNLELKDLIYVVRVVDLLNIPLDEIDITVDEENGDLEADAGLLWWTDEEYTALNGAEVSYDNAAHVTKGLGEYFQKGPQGQTLYYGKTDGIFTRDLTKQYWCSVYVELPDGTYVYSDPKQYGPTTYATSMISKASTAANTKALCVALLNFIASFQEYFFDNVAESDLANASLTEAQKAMIWSDDVANFNLKPEIPADKEVTRDTVIFKNRGNTMLFEDVISLVQQYGTTKNSDITGAAESGVIFWKKGIENGEEIDQFADLEGIPSLDNIGEGVKVDMGLTSGTTWSAFAPGVSAKDMSESSYYILGYVKKTDGTVSYSGITSYTFEQYIYNTAVKNAASKDPALVEFAKRLYIYERAARLALLGY